MPELSAVAVCDPPETAVRLRPATRTDVPALVQLGCAFVHSTSYRDVVAENPAQMARLATQLVEGRDTTVLVLDGPSGLIGMIGLVAYPHHISGERVAGEVFYFVAPAARGRNGLRLLRAAEAWATAQDAASLEMIAPDDRVGAFYARLGYQPVERTYRRVLEGR